eukprot:TRINITY_DN21247_c0_g1_i3.p1 TRINITY_DN21247_c0_g1~~TRINITY_DN21247_c0_g1_i3.p1  ORF type:complete len:428 (-),score=107.50 TRINITY_DN21247_c0_g1_i3:254-1462(-)
MADLLAGEGGPSSHFAPLSSSQTLSICRHLEEQIRQLSGKLDSVAKEMQDSSSHVNELKSMKETLASSLQNLQEDLLGQKTLVDTTRRELGRTNASVQELKGGLAASNESINGLRDAHKVTNTTIEKMGQNLLVTHNLAHKCQEAIEKRIDLDLASLRDELSRTQLDLRHLRADEEVLKAGLQDTRESLRQVDVFAKGVAADLAARTTVVNILEDRLTDTVGGLKATKQSLEDLSTVTLTLHEDHQNTKGTVNEVFAGLKKVGVHVKQVHESLVAEAGKVADAQGSLQDCVAGLENSRQQILDLRGKVQACQQGQDMSKNQINSLRNELAEVNSDTQRVKAGLKETSSILLPNINMDSAEVRTMAARHGSLLGGPSLAGMHHSSPRKPKTSGGVTGRPNAWT